IRAEQQTLRRNSSEVMQKAKLNLAAVEYLNAQLELLQRQEQEAERELADEQKVQEQQEKLEQRVAEFHQRCAEMLEQISDHEFTPGFKFHLDAVLFFGYSCKSGHLTQSRVMRFMLPLQNCGMPLNMGCPAQDPVHRGVCSG